MGCHVDAHEQARWFGDDLGVKRDIRFVDLDGVRADLAFMLGHLGTGKPPLERLRLGLTFLGEGRRSAEAMLGNHCLATDDLAVALGLGDGVRESLRQSFERWDGHGLLGLRGEETVIPARLIAFADVVEVYQRSGGADAAVAVARERSGTQFDPALVELLADEAGPVLGDLGSVSSWDTVIAAEPALARSISDEELGGVLEAVADFVDLKSPYTLGHSRTVADLAGAAAGAFGLPAAELSLVRRAGLVHDLGRLGVSNAVWDKRGELTRTDWERIRLHPYLTERMLASAQSLAPLAAVAAHHHERVDGSGYPRGLGGEALTPAARLLAAADVYTALTEWIARTGRLTRQTTLRRLSAARSARAVSTVTPPMPSSPPQATGYLAAARALRD